MAYMIVGSRRNSLSSELNWSSTLDGTMVRRFAVMITTDYRPPQLGIWRHTDYTQIIMSLARGHTWESRTFSNHLVPFAFSWQGSLANFLYEIWKMDKCLGTWGRKVTYICCKAATAAFEGVRPGQKRCEWKKLFQAPCLLQSTIHFDGFDW